MTRLPRISDWVLMENEDYIVLNKPPYVPCLAERGKITNTPVLEQARKIWPEVTLCHRLDRETSGALLLAKNPAAYRHASMQFENRAVRKVYHAIVDGRIQFDGLRTELPINTDNLANIHIDRKGGKAAITVFETLETFRHFTLMECVPVTGRLHQIRVHLASQNAHIAGDHLYGSETPMLSLIKRKLHGEDTPLIQRFALHAFSLSFTAQDGNELHIDAPYYKDMEVFLKLLRKYDTVS